MNQLSKAAFAVLPLLLVSACDIDANIAPEDVQSAKVNSLVDIPGGDRQLAEAEGVFVVQADSGHDITEAVRSFGGVVRDISEIDGEADHWQVRIDPSGSLSAFEIAQELVTDERIHFTLPALQNETGELIAPINRFGIEFHTADSLRVIEFIDGAGVQSLRSPSPDSGFIAHWFAYPEDVDGHPFDFVDEIIEMRGVRWAEADVIADYRLHYTPADPYYDLQYYLRNDSERFGYNVDINIEPAWQFNFGGGIPSAGGILIAVLDNGVQAAHPDFGGRVNSGYDVMKDNQDCPDCPSMPYQHDAHGTHVGGILAAEHDSQGIAGVAPGAFIEPLRIARHGMMASNLKIAQAINFAWYAAGADILNNSWGGDFYSTAIASAIYDATTQGRNGLGAIVIASAGNTSNRATGTTGPVDFPANLGTTLAVGAINSDGFATNYTPEGPGVDLVAPSSHDGGLNCPDAGDVVTTSLMGMWGCTDGPDGNIDYTSSFGGTSAAAPQAAGAAALLISEDPSLTEGQVRGRLKRNANAWGHSHVFGSGKLDVYRALVDLRIAGPTEITSGGQYQWEADLAGSGPYSYEWQTRIDFQTATCNYKTDWSLAGSESTYTRLVGTHDYDFRIRLEVTENGQTFTDEIKVYVGDGSQTCPE